MAVHTRPTSTDKTTVKRILINNTAAVQARSTFPLTQKTYRVLHLYLKASGYKNIANEHQVINGHDEVPGFYVLWDLMCSVSFSAYVSFFFFFKSCRGIMSSSSSSADLKNQSYAS